MDSIKPTYTRPTRAPSPNGRKSRPVSEGNRIVGYREDRPYSSEAGVQYERRTGRDRRRQRSEKHATYEMRAKPRGRRRTDQPYRGIQTEA